MHYKTIVLELLQERPKLHEQLRASRTLLSTLNDYATALKSCHDSWMSQLRLVRPDSDPIQVSSEALELAIQELQDSLPSESAPDDTEPLSLDAAMDFIRRHTPPG